MDIISRGSWERESAPVKGAKFVFPIRHITFHYTGNVRAPYGVMSYEAERAHLRNVQDSYLNRKPPYSIGYNYAIFQSGRVWELRGTDYRCAANGNIDSNEFGIAVYCVLAVGEEPLEKLTTSAKELDSLICKEAGWKVPQKVHDDWKATGCPGAALTKLVKDGRLRWNLVPETPKPPVGKNEFRGGTENEVKVIIHCPDNVTKLFWDGINLKWYRSSRTVDAVKLAKVSEIGVTEDALRDIIVDSECVGECPYTYSQFAELWNK